jgi:uncharacterized protein involved in exopolysaccharide biosynthesis
MENESENNEEEQSGGGGFNPEALKSYLEFFKRATRPRKKLSRLIVLIGVVLTVLVVRYVPRTYTCTTVLMTVENAVLDENRSAAPLAGAKGLIMGHENLERLIRSTDLIRKAAERRPPLMHLKDKLVEALGGKMDAKTAMASMIGTLEVKLEVTVEKETVEIKSSWSDKVTAAELAEATKQGFLKMRHDAEISAFTEKMAILESHATKLREEVETLAAQMKASLAATAAEVARTGILPGGGKLKTTDRPSASPLMGVGRRRAAPGADLSDLRAELAGLKQKLATAENERNARISAERTKLDELKLRFTPVHPQVMMQEERLGIVSQVSSELALLRADVADAEAQLRQREAMAESGPMGLAARPIAAGPAGAAGAAGAGAAPVVEALPADILELLEREDTEPALAAQMSGAVVRYARLRDDVRGAQMALDTAQAAFNHRYQVVIPVEQPNKPAKPNLIVIGIAGIVLSLLISLIVPIVLELRSGVMVEHWQVQHLQLPVLAELRLPAAQTSDKAGDVH